MPDASRPRQPPRPILLALLALVVAALALRHAFPWMTGILPDDLRPGAEIRIEDRLARPGETIRIPILLRPLGLGAPRAGHQMEFAVEDRPIRIPSTDDAGLAEALWTAPETPGVYSLRVRLSLREGFREARAEGCVAVVSRERPLLVVDALTLFPSMTTEQFLRRPNQDIPPPGTLRSAIAAASETCTIAYLRPADASVPFSPKFSLWLRRYGFPLGPLQGAIPKGSPANAEKAWRFDLLRLATEWPTAAVLTARREEAWFLAAKGVRVLFCNHGKCPPGAEAVRPEEIPSRLSRPPAPGATRPDDARIPPSGQPDKRP